MFFAPRKPGEADMATSTDSPTDQILAQLGADDGLPVDAIRAADANRAAMVPVFLRAFDQCASADPSMREALFFAFHLLGQWRERSAYRPLAAFLHRSEVEPILGDATTVTSHRVMASVFDGDPKPIYDVILDPEVDEFIRARMFDALVIVTLRGELPREETARFLQASYVDLRPQDVCFVWEGWQGAIALLGLSELKPLVRQAFDRGLIDPGWLSFKHFEQDLQCAVQAKPQPGRPANEFELFGDTIEELRNWDYFSPKSESAGEPEEIWDRLSSPSVPAVNPFRGVGRNDPCPCGSGKKFKKCCYASMRAGEVAPGWPQADLDLKWDAVSAADDIDQALSKYDPYVEPKPHQWLALDEQERIDQVLAYHRRAGIRVPDQTMHAMIHAIVENQIADAKLPVRRKVQRLMSEGLDRHDAIHAIGTVVAERLFDVAHAADAEKVSDQSGRKTKEAYFAEIEALTAKSWRRRA
jgi:hypothetical protein